VLNSRPGGTSDGPDLRRAFEIASHDCFSCNCKANRLVTLSSRRGACISHAGSFEIGVFSLSLCWLVNGISRVVLVSVWHHAGVYMGLMGKGGRLSQGWPLGENIMTRSSSCEGLESSSTSITDL